jgi:hypothetical protein
VKFAFYAFLLSPPQPKPDVEKDEAKLIIHQEKLLAVIFVFYFLLQLVFPRLSAVFFRNDGSIYLPLWL